MENLQIKAEFIIKLVGVCVAGCAYYFTLKNSFNLLNERQRVCKKRLDLLEEELTSTHESLTILKTQHEENCGKKKR
jgi:hypothetical protein